MTNLERIKNMSAKELGGFLAELEWHIAVDNFMSCYDSDKLDSLLISTHDESEPMSFTNWLNDKYKG